MKMMSFGLIIIHVISLHMCYERKSAADVKMEIPVLV